MPIAMYATMCGWVSWQGKVYIYIYFLDISFCGDHTFKSTHRFQQYFVLAKRYRGCWFGSYKSYSWRGLVHSPSDILWAPIISWDKGLFQTDLWLQILLSKWNSGALPIIMCWKLNDKVKHSADFVLRLKLKLPLSGQKYLLKFRNSNISM